MYISIRLHFQFHSIEKTTHSNFSYITKIHEVKLKYSVLFRSALPVFSESTLNSLWLDHFLSLNSEKYNIEDAPVSILCSYHFVSNNR